MQDRRTQNKPVVNVKIGILLFSIVLLIFAITIVKLKQGALMQGYDHILRQNLVDKYEK